MRSGATLFPRLMPARIEGTGAGAFSSLSTKKTMSNQGSDWICRLVNFPAGDLAAARELSPSSRQSETIEETRYLQAVAVRENVKLPAPQTRSRHPREVLEG